MKFLCKMLFVFALAITVTLCYMWYFNSDDYKIEEWEHGFKTELVIATRYTGSAGYSIRFDFPENKYDSDRAELLDYIEKHGGFVYQSGGWPGAPIYAAFTGVVDKETANIKIKEVLLVVMVYIINLGVQYKNEGKNEYVVLPSCFINYRARGLED